MRSNTVLVTVMHANNEVGTLQPIHAIAEVAHEAGALIHVDAAQSVGKIPVNVDELGVDLLTIAGHKLYAPKGIGALYLRAGTVVDPLIHGAGQEHGMRAGTENVASMVALGAACEIAGRALPDEGPRLQRLRDRLHSALRDAIPGLLLNGHPAQRLPNTLNVSVPASGTEVLAAAPDVAASTGSACHSGDTIPSSVLTAMGLSRDRAIGALRLSLGRWSTEEEIDLAAECLAIAFRSVSSVSMAR